MYKFFILGISQLSFLSYLISSYFEHNFDNPVRLSLKLLFLVFWFFLYIYSFNLIKSFKIRIYYYNILLLSLLLTALGIFIGQRPHDSLYVFILLFTYLHILIYLSAQKISYNIDLLRKIILCSVILYVFSNYLNLYLNGNSLYTLGMIQFPLLFLGSLVITIFDKRSRFFLLLALLIFICVVLHGALIEIENNSLRIQFLPAAMTFMIAIVFLLITLKLSKNIYFWIVFLSFLVIFLYYSEIAYFFHFENRFTSFMERFYIFLFMLQESFWFIVPQGFGASLKQFNLSNLSFIGDRFLYPPHSGIAVILYEFSVFGAIYLFIMINKILVISSSHDDILPKSNYSEFTFNKLKFLNLFIIFIWIIHNLLYLKGVINADYFSDDGIIIYMLILIITSTRK